MTYDLGKELNNVSRDAYSTSLAFIKSFHDVGKGISEENYQRLLGYIQACIDRRKEAKE